MDGFALRSLLLLLPQEAPSSFPASVLVYVGCQSVKSEQLCRITFLSFTVRCGNLYSR